MTTKAANKKTKRASTKVQKVHESRSKNLDQCWELVTFLGFPWEEAKKYKGAELVFLLEKAEENKVEFLKRQKREEEERLNRERYVAQMQQQQQQAFQQQQQAQMQQQMQGNPYQQQQPPQGLPPQ